jgi:hypothetical protein
MCKLVVYIVHFRARKSRQKQQENGEKWSLITEHFFNKDGEEGWSNWKQGSWWKRQCVLGEEDSHTARKQQPTIMLTL